MPSQNKGVGVPYSMCIIMVPKVSNKMQSTWPYFITRNYTHGYLTISSWNSERVSIEMGEVAIISPSIECTLYKISQVKQVGDSMQACCKP